MKINLTDEISIRLNHPDDKKTFTETINKMDVDSLLELSENLNNLFNQNLSLKQNKGLVKLFNKVISHLNKVLITLPKHKIDNDEEDANLSISFRHDEGKRMHGAFFDHYVFRKITNRRTKILSTPETNLNKFKEFVRQSTLGLGINSQLGHKVIPESIHNTEKEGLIIIPGYSRQLYDKDRISFENEIIKNACLTGQPILAICAGSWTLWQSFGGTLKEVEHHVYSSMPYLVTDGGVGNNKQIHEVTLLNNTIVSGVMNRNIQTNPEVNSVHWMAPNETNIPNMLEICAHSRHSLQHDVLNRQGNIMVPENNTVEAFETKYGAPMIGIQWHPECYYSKQKTSEEQQRHLNLIHYMVKAGDTYRAKGYVLSELKSTLKLRQFSIFKTLAAMHDLEYMNLNV